MTSVLAGLSTGVLIGAGFAPGALATSLEDGVAWLEANQDASGLWNATGETPFRDTAFVTEILARFGTLPAVLAAGEAVLDGTEVQSVDFRARRVLALASGSLLDADEVTALAADQNEDGGWGYAPGYASNALDTGLALRALKTAGYTGAALYIAGAGFLTGTQNGDGGWGLVDADASDVFVTSHAVIALAAVASEVSVGTEITAGVDWLQTQDNGDGGFGPAGVSTPYHTGLAMAAVFRDEPAATELSAGKTYLESIQNPSGSWTDDAYHTAAAIFGLSQVGPDLEITSPDIALSDPTPIDGDLVTVTVTVHNAGVVDAADVTVQLFDGDPSSGGTQIGTDVVVPLLAAGTSTGVDFDWDTTDLGGDHFLYARVDPADAVFEPDELNNEANTFVHVFLPPNLTFDPDGITFDPEAPEVGETVIVSITVRNDGETEAVDASLQLYRLPLEQDGDLVALLGSPYIIPSIIPGSQFTLNVNMGTYFNQERDYDLMACADEEDAIREVSEFDNCHQATLWVGPQPFPVSMATGLNFLSLPATPDEPLFANEAIAGLPGGDEVSGWSRADQRWLSAVHAGGGVYVGEDFPIPLRDGFFARTTSPGTYPFVGRALGSHDCTSLEVGLNAVSVPNADACYTAYTLIDAVTGADAAYRWDATLQMWETTIKTAPDTFVGPDFAITPGHAYFVRTITAADFCSETCTGPMLPDLRVTPSDIFFDTNPVGVGQPVGIYVNIDNIGEVDVTTPRLDIWAGDPDGGGSQLLSAPLPVDAPAGGSTGFWGGTFSFGSPGTIDIYGIADFLDEVLESDETNNQASSPLIVTTASRPEGPESSSAIAKAGPGARPSSSEPVLTDPVHTVVAPDGTDVTSRVTSDAPASIQDVLVTNVTSSSATITWITDRATVGCVRAGRSSPAQTFCERTIAGTTHAVVVEGLRADTEHVFAIVDGDAGVETSVDFVFRTTPVGAGTPVALHGRLVERGAEDGSDGDVSAGDVGVAHAIVSAALLRDGGGSIPLSTRTASDGSWSMNLGNLKDPATGAPLGARVGDAVILRAQAGPERVGTQRVMIGSLDVIDAGTLRLGAEDVPETTPPAAYFLAANRPNPFTSQTTFTFGLPESELVTLEVFDVLGRRIVELQHGELPAATHAITWDGRDRSGRIVPAGAYFYRLRAGSFTQVRKLLIVR